MPQNEKISDNSIERNQLDYLYLIEILAKYRKLIIITTFTITVITVIYVLVATKIYVSQVTLYPITKDEGGPLKELSMQLGIGAKPEGYYLPDVLKSNRISKKVILKKYKIENMKDSLNLIQFWEFDQMEVSDNTKIELAISTLSGSIQIKENKETTLITLKVFSTQKELAKQIAEYYYQVVTLYLQEELVSSIRSTITFTEKRLKETKEELLAAETDLILFQEINSKISSPALTIENTRKYFRVQLAKDIYSLLEKQIQLLKIEEVRKKPVLNLLDLPEVSDQHVKPTKRKTVMLSTFLGFIFSFSMALVVEKLKQKKIFSDIKTVIVKYK